MKKVKKNMFYKYVLKTVPLLCIAACFVGCASTGVDRTSLSRSRALSTDFDPDDLRDTVTSLVEDMATFPSVVELTAKGRPVLTMERLRNDTGQIDLDTKNITDAIRTQLLRTGKFRFKDRTTSELDIAIINEQNNQGLTDTAKAVQPGQQTASELYLYGAITEMVQKAGRIKDVYYKVTLNLKDLKTGELLWSEYKELRKEKKRPVFGL